MPAKYDPSRWFKTPTIQITHQQGRKTSELFADVVFPTEQGQRRVNICDALDGKVKVPKEVKKFAHEWLYA